MGGTRLQHKGRAGPPTSAAAHRRVWHSIECRRASSVGNPKTQDDAPRALRWGPPVRKESDGPHGDRWRLSRSYADVPTDGLPAARDALEPRGEKRGPLSCAVGVGGSGRLALHAAGPPPETARRSFGLLAAGCTSLRGNWRLEGLLSSPGVDAGGERGNRRNARREKPHGPVRRLGVWSSMEAQTRFEDGGGRAARAATGELIARSPMQPKPMLRLERAHSIPIFPAPLSGQTPPPPHGVRDG